MSTAHGGGPAPGSGGTRDVSRLPWRPMRVMVVGAGGVGSAIATAASSSEGLDHVAVTDLDGGRATRAIDRLDARRFAAFALDASDATAIETLARAEQIDAIVNACDPRLN